ncbi:MAG TPA: hypothetical protein DC034_11300 [Clostridium sp.]|nr:hypothetical protein [Clostridium sp.]
MKSNKLIDNTRIAVVMLCLALALRQMSMTIVMPFISTYCKSLKGYTPVLAGLAVGIFGLTQAIFQIPFGVLSDEYGNKKNDAGRTHSSCCRTFYRVYFQKYQSFNFRTGTAGKRCSNRRGLFMDCKYG